MNERMTRLRDVLSNYRDDYSLCGKCKLCHGSDACEVYEGRFWRNCPSGTRFRFEGYYASGRLEMARALELFETEPTPLMIHSLYSCMLCGSCQDRCYHVKQMLPMRVFELMREKAVREGWGPPDAFAPVFENLEAADNIFGRPQADRASWAEGLGLKDAAEEGAGAVLFAGCRYSMDPAMAGAARSAARLLAAAGLDLGTLGGEELCCGAPVLELGDRDFFEAFAAENIRRIEASGASLVVSLCAHCARVMAEEYAPETGVEFKHATEVLASAVDEGRIRPTVEVPVKAAWHDPCNLGRRLGLYDEPRRILGSIPGVEMVELPRSGHNALCCGNGGMAAYADPGYAEWVAKERVFEAESTGADRLVTACPH